jgi:hypothetical protein
MLSANLGININTLRKVRYLPTTLAFLLPNPVPHCSILLSTPQLSPQIPPLLLHFTLENFNLSMPSMITSLANPRTTHDRPNPTAPGHVLNITFSCQPPSLVSTSPSNPNLPLSSQPPSLISTSTLSPQTRPLIPTFHPLCIIQLCYGPAI